MALAANPMASSGELQLRRKRLLQGFLIHLKLFNPTLSTSSENAQVTSHLTVLR